MKDGVVSCLVGYAAAAARSACLSLSVKEREGPAPKGEGNDVFDDCVAADGGGGYDLAPEMTSEREGSDCRFVGSMSSGLRDGSIAEALPLDTY